MQLEQLCIPSEKFALRTIEAMKYVRKRAQELREIGLSSTCTPLEKQCVFESVDKFELLTYQIILNVNASNLIIEADNQFSQENYEKLRQSVSEEIANFEMASITVQQIQDTRSHPCSDEVSARKCLKLFGQIEQSLCAYAGKVRRLRCRRREKSPNLLALGLLLNVAAEGKFGFYLCHEALVPDKFWRSVVSSYRRKAEKHLKI